MKNRMLHIYYIQNNNLFIIILQMNSYLIIWSIMYINKIIKNIIENIDVYVPEILFKITFYELILITNKLC